MDKLEDQIYTQNQIERYLNYSAEEAIKKERQKVWLVILSNHKNRFFKFVSDNDENLDIENQVRSVNLYTHLNITGQRGYRRARSTH
jgi:hypothetical protein